VHRDRFLVNKTNRCTKFQLYWYYNSTCFGQSFCPSSGVLAVQRRWYNLCSLGGQVLPGMGCYIHQNCINRMNAAVRLELLMMGRKTAQNMQSCNDNKVGTWCICWFYSQEIYHDAQSYSLKIHHYIYCFQEKAFY
jgi:hypothetical protein